MEIQKTEEGSAVLLTLKGELNAEAAAELERAIRGLNDGVTDLVLDFGGVTDISTPGLRLVALTSVDMQKRGSLTLLGVSPAVMDCFQRTGLDGRLTILHE